MTYMQRRRLPILAALTILLCLTAAACNGETEPDKQIASGGKPLVLLYHTLTEGDVPPVGNLLVYTSAAKFEEDIVTLMDNGYESLSLEMLYRKEYAEDGLYFAITFDDGYLSNYETAFPILLKYNCYADIFINTDNETMEHHFSFAQAREMEDSGLVRIHSHFPVHEDVSVYDKEDFLEGLAKSFDTLTEQLGPRGALFFAYPYGAATRENYDIAKEYGVKLQFVQTKLFDEEDVILRENVAYDTDMEELMHRLAPQGDTAE